MKIGHIFLQTTAEDRRRQFIDLVEACDRLAVEQHVLVASVSLARRLQSCPYVSVGPVVRSAVMAYCLMPPVDLVHIHDDKGGQAGLLLTLTRSTPYVITTNEDEVDRRNPLQRSVLQRAQTCIDPRDASPENLMLVYEEAIRSWSELPEDADCG